MGSQKFSQYIRTFCTGWFILNTIVSFSFFETLIQKHSSGKFLSPSLKTQSFPIPHCFMRIEDHKFICYRHGKILFSILCKRVKINFVCSRFMSSSVFAQCGKNALFFAIKAKIGISHENGPKICKSSPNHQSVLFITENLSSGSQGM